MRATEEAPSSISAERVIGLLLVAAIVLAALWVTRPLYGVLAWGIFTAIALAPLHAKLAHIVGNRPKTAATIVVLALMAIIVVPLSFLPASFENASLKLAALTNNWTTLSLPPMPQWIGDIPIVGSKISEKWNAAVGNSREFLSQVKPYVIPAFRWIAASGASLSLVILQILLSVVLAGIFLVTQASTTSTVHRIAGRIGGTSGEGLVEVAVRTIRSVVQGVIGTAVIQALLTGIGFAIAGVPFAAALGILSFGTAMLQIGTWLVWIPVALWLSYQGETGFAIFTAVLGVIINVLDNVIKPILIGHGAGVPLWVIFIGVIGGVLSMGLIGILIGPLVMALTYSLIIGWLSDDKRTRVKYDRNPVAAE